MRQAVIKWGLFVLLSVIWGSSFLLMLVGMEEHRLSPWQVAAFRLFAAGLVMIPFAMGAIRRIPADKRFYAVLSGFLGSFFPAFLFCLAETRLDSSFAGTLNSLTPIFVLLVGALFFGLHPNRSQVLGIVISFCGSIGLFMSKSGKTGDLLYVGFIVLATIFYGINVNMVSRRLKELASMDIAAMAFGFLTIPSLAILLATGTQHLDYTNPLIWRSVGASALLGLLGTAMASIIFYVLLKKAGGVFASTVTYGIPFVAIALGRIFYKESLNLFGWLSLLVILGGIFITNIKRKPPAGAAGN